MSRIVVNVVFGVFSDRVSFLIFDNIYDNRQKFLVSLGSTAETVILRCLAMAPSILTSVAGTKLFV